MKKGKKYQEAAKLVEKGKLYDPQEALSVVCKTATAKFDETIELHVKLGVDSRHADQQVRGAVVLPNGTGKKVRVLVFARDDKAEAAKAAGADYVGAEELAQKIQSENWFDFDVVIASPDMMGVVGRIGRVLGPKGLMPNPKASFGPEKLGANFNVLMGAIIKAKPSAAKGTYLKSVTIASTMGPGVKIAANKLEN